MTAVREADVDRKKLPFWGQLEECEGMMLIGTASESDVALADSGHGKNQETDY